MKASAIIYNRLDGSPVALFDETDETPSEALERNGYDPAQYGCVVFSRDAGYEVADYVVDSNGEAMLSATADNARRSRLSDLQQHLDPVLWAFIQWLVDELNARRIADGESTLSLADVRQQIRSRL